MANAKHVEVVKQGAERIRGWRNENKGWVRLRLAQADLRGLDLRGADLYGELERAPVGRSPQRGARLRGADFRGADLREADLAAAHLREADLRRANLAGAHLEDADLTAADLTAADLTAADLTAARLFAARLNKADLSRADLSRADLLGADLRGARLHGADLSGADLTKSNLCGVNLEGVNLEYAILVETNLERAVLRDCRVYGISAWNVKLVGAEQINLVVTPWHEPPIATDNLEVAQFLYLLLHNEKIRSVIDTITSKVVLILGRFTPERKAVLDAIREALRASDPPLVPVLFDFDVPADRDITETVTLLARMARFVIADLTEPSSIPKELEAFVPDLAVPVQPLLQGLARPYSMFKDYWKYHWVLPVHRYETLDGLLASLREKVIAPAEAKRKDLAELRNRQQE